MNEQKPCPITKEEAANAADVLMQIAPKNLQQVKALSAANKVLLWVVLFHQAAPESKRLIDADALSDEIKRLRIFLAGESIFTPTIKETILRTIDEQPTVGSTPENKPLTLDELRRMDGEPVWCAGETHFGIPFDGWKVLKKHNRSPGVIRFTDGSAWVNEKYGITLLAYDRKLEKEDHT